MCCCILDWVWSEEKKTLCRCFLSAVLFYAIWKVKANKRRLKLNGRFSFWSIVMTLADCGKTNWHILMMLADCGKTNWHISKEMKGGAFLFASKYFSLVEIAEMKVGQTQNTKISKRSSEIVSAFRYFGRSIKNRNWIFKKIKNELKFFWLLFWLFCYLLNYPVQQISFWS